MRAAGEPAGRSDGRRELRTLLLRVEEGHREEILTYCSGHLNPNRRPQRKPSRTVMATEPKWTGSTAPERGTVMRQPAQMQPEVEWRRKNSLAIATVAAVAAPVAAESPQSEKRQKHPCRPLDQTRAILLNTSQSRENELASGGPEDRCVESLISGMTRKGWLRTNWGFERSAVKTLDPREPKGRSKSAKKQEKRLEQVLNQFTCDYTAVPGKEVPFRARSNQSPRVSPLKPGAPPAGDLKEAREEVLRLEQDARKSLMDNDELAIPRRVTLKTMRAAGEPAGRSDGRRELRTLLLRVEEGHREEILTYCSGHLNPNRRPQRKPSRTVMATEPKWTGSTAPERGTVMRQPAQMQPEVEWRRKNSLAIATVAAVAAPVAAESPQSEKRQKHPCRPLDQTRAILLNTSQSRENELASGGPEDRCVESLISGMTRKGWLRTNWGFERSAVKTLDPREPKGRSKSAKKQEKRLEQVLNQFTCDYTAVPGKEVPFRARSNQSPRVSPLKPGAPPAGDLKEAREEVLRLEQDARKSLMDNDEARMELKRERDQVQHINGEQKQQVDQQDPKPGGIVVSPSDQVLHKRRQVWTVLEEVRLLENVIREQMASEDTTRATESYIQDLEAEITALSTSNKQLFEANKELQRSISSLLDEVKITREMQKEFWGRFGHTETKSEIQRY